MRDTRTCTAKRHGTPSAYRHYRCRCPETVEAHRLYNKRLRQGRPEVRRLPAFPITRRIQALMAIGHTAEVIGAEVGRGRAAVIATARMRKWVTPATDAAYRAAYDKLSMIPGVSASTRARSRCWGYAPPLAWDEDSIDDPASQPRFGPQRSSDGEVDEAAVERALANDPSALTRMVDRRAAIARMRAAGVEVPVIAERLAAKTETIERSIAREDARKRSRQQAADTDQGAKGVMAA